MNDLMTADRLNRTAVFSRCRKYRYLLTRRWDNTLPTALFIALNPSTADATHDDPTVRRCVGFARAWGFGGLLVANLFAFRSTDPRRLADVTDPIGPKNDDWLNRVMAEASITIAAWGIHGDLADRGSAVLSRLTNAHHLGLTKSGQPRHPLYLPGTIQPIRF